MNIKKLNQAILKDYQSNCPKFNYGEWEDNIFVCNNYVGHLIPKELFPFDFEKLSIGKWINAGSILNNISLSWEESTKTDDLKYIEKTKTIAVRYDSQFSDKSAWFDNKLFDYFDFYRVLISGDKTPAKIYEGDRLAGIIMPMIVK